MNDGNDNVESEGLESVGKIREILFGEQMAVYEERFTDLESRLVEQVSALKQDINSSLQEMRDLMDRQKSDLSNAGVHRKNLSDAFQRMADELKKEPS